MSLSVTAIVQDGKPFKWIRHRFHANPSDPRPVIFPPPGPYWISGYSGGDEYAIVVAYLPPTVCVTEYWPEATDVDSECCDAIVFTDRFPKPHWWMSEVRA